MINHNILEKIHRNVWVLTYDSVMSHLLYNFRAINNMGFYFPAIAYIGFMNLNRKSKCWTCNTTYPNPLKHMCRREHINKHSEKHIWLMDDLQRIWSDENCIENTAHSLFSRTFLNSILDEYVGEDTLCICVNYIYDDDNDNFRV